MNPARTLGSAFPAQYVSRALDYFTVSAARNADRGQSSTSLRFRAIGTVPSFITRITNGAFFVAVHGDETRVESRRYRDNFESERNTMNTKQALRRHHHGPGAGGGTLVHTLARPGKAFSFWNAATMFPARRPTGIRERSM